MRDWLRKRGIEKPTDLELRLKGIAVDHAAFRGTPTPEAIEPPARAADARPLADVIAALAQAGLAPVELRRGFEVRGSKDGLVLRGFVDDPKRVLPELLSFVTNEAEMGIDVAHALVPLFGPLGADYGNAGWLVIDGTRSVADVRTELGKRYAAMVRQMLDMMNQLGDLLQPIRKALGRKDGD